MQETWVQSLSQEDPLEKEIATHSSILAREIPWTEEPDGLQCMGSHRVGHGWEHARTRTHTHTHTHTNTLRINVFTSYHALLQAHWVLLCLWSWCLTPRMSCPCFSTCWAHFWSLIFGLHSLYLPLDPSNHVELINSSSLSSWYYVPLRSIAVITLSKKKKKHLTSFMTAIFRGKNLGLNCSLYLQSLLSSW